MKTLLIAGANGFMARYLTRYFHAEDWNVVGLARHHAGMDEHDEITGPINMTAPDPICNAEVMRRFRDLANRPFGLPATKWMAEIGAFFLRTETELILKSRWVVPTRLLENGFVFTHPEMKPKEW